MVLALEKLNYFGSEYIKIYTDWSRDIDGNSGRGTVIEFDNRTQNLSHTNPRGCLAMNEEIKATEMAFPGQLKHFPL